MYKIVYCNLCNVGDKLNEYILKKIGKNYEIHPDKLDKDYYLFIGSLVQPAYCDKNAVICGAGYFLGNKKVDVKKILFVRGKLTRNKLLEQGYECPEIYGDPGLIMSRIYIPKPSEQKVIGFTPHIYDYKNYLAGNMENVINMGTDNVEHVIDNICQYKYIVSSSLHGIILAHSYGIKALWVNLYDNGKLHGDPIKFLDYYSSLDVDIENIKPWNIQNFLKLNENDRIDIIEKYHNPTQEIISKIINDIITNTPFID